MSDDATSIGSSSPLEESSESIEATGYQAALLQAAETALALKRQGNAGANWFFWVAALSLVNTIIAHTGGDRHFIVGLSFTAIVDAIAQEVGKQSPELATVAVSVAIGFSCFVALVATLFGWMSRKRWLAAYAIGMAIYVVDGLLYLLLGDFLSAAFHGYVMWSMVNGFKAYRQLSQVEEAIRIMSASDGEATAFDHSANG